MEPPTGPDEGLVVESGRKERCQGPEQRTRVECGRRPAIDRNRLQPLLQSHGRCGLIGAGLGACQFNQGAGLVMAAGDDSTRAVILEAPRRNRDAVRHERRRQAVPLAPGQTPAVEGEAQRRGAVDQAPGRKAIDAGHGRKPSTATISWVCVFLTTRTHPPHPRSCHHHSLTSPSGLGGTVSCLTHSRSPRVPASSGLGPKSGPPWLNSRSSRRPQNGQSMISIALDRNRGSGFQDELKPVEPVKHKALRQGMRRAGRDQVGEGQPAGRDRLVASPPAGADEETGNAGR